jgi:hypothetical protein
MELLHLWRGSPHPQHKVSSPLHTKPEGRRRLPVSHLGPKASGTPYTTWFTQESPHNIGTTLHSLGSKLNLALSTHTQSMCKSMDEQFSTWMAWIWSSKCLALLCTPTQSSNLKWASGGGINSLRQQTSYWDKAVEIRTSNDSRLCFFRASVDLVLQTVALQCTWPLTQLTQCFIRCIVGSSDVEDFMAKTLLLAPSRLSDESLLHRWFIRCYYSSLGVSLSCSNLTSDRPTVPSNGPLVHPTLLTSLLCLFYSSDACRMRIVGSSDGASWFQPLRSVPSASTLASWVPSVHLTVGFFFLCLQLAIT